MNHSKFEKELQQLINRHCVENESDTPDFILVTYLKTCLDAFNTGVKARDQWFGRGGGSAPANVVVIEAKGAEYGQETRH